MNPIRALLAILSKQQQASDLWIVALIEARSTMHDNCHQPNRRLPLVEATAT